MPDARGVKVRVTFDSESSYPIEQQRAGWQAIPRQFAYYVESKRTA